MMNMSLEEFDRKFSESEYFKRSRLWREQIEKILNAEENWMRGLSESIRSKS